MTDPLIVSQSTATTATVVATTLLLCVESAKLLVDRYGVPEVLRR